MVKRKLRVAVINYARRALRQRRSRSYIPGEYLASAKPITGSRRLPVALPLPESSTER